MERTHNSIHSYGRELGYQFHGSDALSHQESNRREELVIGELEDTSSKTDSRLSKSKNKWGVAGLKERAKARLPGKPKGATSAGDIPAPLRIHKPTTAVELPDNEIAGPQSYSLNAFETSQTASPHDPSDIEYIYDNNKRQLVRNPNRRNCDSNGSTTAQADTLMHSELDGPEKSFPPPKVSRRALNSSSALGTDGLFAQETHSSDAERLELSQISVSVLKAGTKYPELRGPEDESTEKAVARFLRQYGQISASMRDPQGRLDTSGPSKRDLIKAQDELRAVKTRLLDQDDKLERYEGEFDDMNRTIASLKFQLKESESSHGVKLRKEQRSLQSENERLKSFYENQLRKSRDDAAFDRSEAHKRQKEDIKTIEGLETRLLKDATLWEQAYNKLKATNSDLEQRLHDAKADENERVYDLEAKWERKLQKEKVKYEDSINSLELDIGRLEGALAKERSHKEAELQNQRKELEEKYKEEKDGLRTEIDMFKVAVTQREHFKGLTDSEVANHYKRLANSIEDFSRVEWDFSKREAWPISESHMRQLGKNPRKMKLQIVQNTLWVLLYKLVFCSPFKILGAAGEEDDDERWTKIYSAGASSFEWPEIPAEVERSRFENAKAYTNAVGSTTNSSVRESFERSVTAIMNSIIRATERVATIQANDHRVLETVVRLAGKIWLESCSQRYRVVVVVSHGSGDILSLPGEFEGTLRLVVRPEVKRYGDSQGKHLTRGEPVAGWKGLLETYPQ